MLDSVEAIHCHQYFVWLTFVDLSLLPPTDNNWARTINDCLDDNKTEDYQNFVLCRIVHGGDMHALVGRVSQRCQKVFWRRLLMAKSME